MPKKNEALVKAVRDAEQDGILEILRETRSGILTYDYQYDREIRYRITPPNTGWLRRVIHILPKARTYGIMTKTETIDLLMSVDPEMLTTLKHVFAVADENDARLACEIAGTDMEEFPETIDFEENDMLGCLWSLQSSIIVNLAAIKKTIDEMETENDGSYLSFNRANEEHIGVYTTITHEIRHLGLSNPFSREDGESHENEESAVEAWGIAAYENWMENRKYLK